MFDWLYCPIVMDDRKGSHNTIRKCDVAKILGITYVQSPSLQLKFLLVDFSVPHLEQMSVLFYEQNVRVYFQTCSNISVREFIIQ